MAFKMKYKVGTDYLPKGTKRRSGTKAAKIRFVVLHDVGNDGYNKKTGRKNGTTARNNISYYRNSPNISASAHTFIDDKEILECIPAVTAATEKAWHVLYDRTLDNKIYGDDANDAAIGVELCYYPEDKERSLEAYKKFVWYCAYLAYYFKLDPKVCFIGHEKIDPGRKTDPSNGLKWIGKTTAGCIQDIINEYNECLGKTNDKGELTMSQYNELKALITKQQAEINALKAEKADKRADTVDASHKEAWTWAEKEGLMNGQNPGGAITRQQFTTVLSRFAKKFLK